MFEKFLNKYRFVKVTLFTIPNSKFKYEGRFLDIWEENKFIITNKKFSKWRIWINKFKNQVEIANHGLYHWQNDVVGLLQNREFEFKNKEQCVATLQKSQKIFLDAGFSPVGFKPGGWGIGYNLGFPLIKALKELNLFNYVCLSTPNSGLNWDKKRVSNIYPQYYKGLLNLPQNLSILEPIEEIYKKIDEIANFNGIITLQLHFNEQNYWMEDGIGIENIKKIERIVKYINKKFSNKVWFAKLKEIARWWRKKYPE